jgi:Cytochrome C oxidase, cbb3-type, subunit III
MSPPERTTHRPRRARPSPGGSRIAARAVSAVVLLAAAGACRQDMFNQPRLKPLAESDFYPDRMSARPPVPDTVARSERITDRALDTGIGEDGRFVSRLPVPLTRALLVRGRERFDIFCSPCHGRVGDGRGMIVQRGLKAPPSYHIDRLRRQPVGYLFDVATNGFGQMSGYRSQVTPDDRWAIVAYIRALQLSQHAGIDAVPAGDRRALEAAGRRP